MSLKDKLVSDFLIYSCAYYKHGKSLITDAEFDEITLQIKDNYEVIDHMHKYLISQEMLDTTSAYALEEYPLIVEVIVSNLIKED